MATNKLNANGKCFSRSAIALLFSATILASCSDNGNGHDATGVFEATEVTVSAATAGTILALNVEEGDTIGSDTPLGLVDTTQLYLKRLQLQANIRAISTRAQNISVQTAALNEQIATAERERIRFTTLARQGAATQKQVDDITAQLATLRKQLAAQTETLSSNNISISDEQAALAAQIAQIDDQIRQSIIQSPVAGTVLTKYAEQGEWAMTSRPLFTVADISTLYLRAYITAPQLTTVKIGQQAKVYADMGEDGSKEYAGKVVWIADQAEFTPKTIQTRDERSNLVYAIKIAVRNDGYIKRGMYGEVQFKSEQ